MTIDDRLDRLTERHEALTQSVKLLRAHGNEFSERLARQAEKSDRESRRSITRCAVPYAWQ